MNKKLVIAIDGPSASGKGTLAKKIAQHFDLSYLNTGAIYRAVALKMISHKINFDDFDQNIPILIANISESDLEKEELFDEVVGATAIVVEFLRLYPLRRSGSPKMPANSSVALSVFSRIAFQISMFRIFASIDSNPISFD